MTHRAQQKFRPIPPRLLKVVVASSVAVTAFFTTLETILDYKSKADHLEASMASVQSDLVPSIEELLGREDLSTVKAKLNSALSSMDASEIRLTSDSGTILYSERLKDAEPQIIETKRFNLSIILPDSTTRSLGHLDMTFYRDKVVAAVAQNSLRTLFWNTLKIFAVGAIALMIFRRRVEQSADASTRTPTPDIDTHEADENLRLETLRGETAARLAQLGEMAAGIAHEVNNPLAIISGYNHFIRAELKQTAPRIEKVMAAIDSIEKTIHRITKIIIGLRAYARDGSNDPKEMTPIRQMIEDALALTESKLNSSGVVIRRSPGQEDGLIISCRAVQIVQVIVALINNSLDAIRGQSNAWIEITVIRKGQHLELTITDSGAGIAPELGKRIFEPFFTTKQVGHGTGLGLSIAYGIIKDHDGEIFLDHSCKNTRFVIRLTAASLSAEESAA
jgi:signal transduction histidine kinase